MHDYKPIWLLNLVYLLHAGKTAEEQGWSVTLPGGSTYQWPVQEQGRRIPFAREQTVEGTYLNILNRKELLQVYSMQLLVNKHDD